MTDSDRREPLNPATVLMEIMDAGRQPIIWLSRAHFAERFGDEAAQQCVTMDARLVHDGKRYGVISLRESKVTPWMGFRPRESRWVETCNAAADLIDGYRVRLGDGTHKRKDDECNQATE